MLKKILIEKGAPVAADVLAVILYLVFLPRLILFFQKKSPLNACVVGTVYIIFCVSVVVIRKIPVSAEKKDGFRKGWMGFFGITFGIFVTFIMAETAGLFERLDSVSGTTQGKTAALVLGGVFLWLILAFLYMIVLMVDVKPARKNGTVFPWVVELFALLGVNAMILITVGFWHAYFSAVEPYADLAAGGKILIFLVTYIFFMLFFAAPRMLFLLKRPGAAGVVSFILQTGYYVWHLLSGTAWN